MTDQMTLWQNPGWGSTVVEMQAEFYGMPLTLVEAGDLFKGAADRARLAPLNPIMQIPTLVLPGGEVVTESAAITLLFADMAGSDTLVPRPGAPERAAFLRWLIFLVAAIYPTFVFGDLPERYVPAAQADGLKERMNEERRKLWRVVEAEAMRRGGPWFLGGRMSAIDIYLAAMVRWTPGQAWFAAECPHVFSAGEAAARLPGVAAAFARNFSAADG
jgi:GST-like protein